MVNPSIYTVGGTVQAGGGIYIPRQADEELLNLCRSATFAYVLTPRQMGKSSLMVRTAERLNDESIQTVIIDLTQIGTQVSAEAWYLGLLTIMEDQLMLDTNVVQWWQAHSHLGITQRLTLFFEKVLLAEVKERVAIFVDEIDTTLSLDFTDDFYAAIRYLYVARATNPEFQRLSCVLIGVATPGDLIRDAKRTPFNIGQRVDLTDFTFEEALPLAEGLKQIADDAQQVLRWVLNWTGGHPYLTQRLCRAITEQGKSSWSKADVDRVVSNTFLGAMSEQDNNLQFVRDMLTKRAPEGLEKDTLNIYREIRRGKPKVVDEEQSLVKSHLKLSGVVRREGNALAVRNAIYRQVFDEHWIWEHYPENLWQRLKPALPLIATLSIFSLGMGGLAWYAFQQTAEAEKQKTNAQLFAQSLTSDSYLAAGFNIEALIEGLRTGQTLQKLDKDKKYIVEPDIRMRAVATLQEVVYGHVAYGAEKNRLEGYSSSVFSVAFSPDGKTIASGSADNTVRLWNLHGEAIKTLKGHSSRVISVAFSPDGKTIASGSADNTVRLWNLQGANIKTLKGHSSRVNSVAFSPDGKTIASGSDDNTVRLWNLQGENIKTLKGHSSFVSSVTFSPDGKTIASGSGDNTVRLWNLQGENIKTLKGHSTSVYSVAFSPDGKTIATATGSYDNTVRLWNLQGQAIKTLKGHSGSVYSVAFSPDGKTIASGSSDNTMRLWNLQGQAIATLKGHSSPVSSVAFSPDGKTIVSGSAEVRLWNLQGQAIATLKGHSSYITSVAFSPDGKTIASGSDDNTVRLWNLHGEAIATLKGHSSRVYSVTFSPDGKTIASGSNDNTVRLWNLQGQAIATLKEHSSSVFSVAFSPDGKTIATDSTDNTVRLWNLQGQAIATLKGHSSYVTSVAFSPDGKTIVSSSNDNTVRLWNLHGEAIATLKGHSSSVSSVAFSPDGKTIVSGSHDNTVRLWNLHGEAIKTLKGHSSYVTSVAFSPDGKTIASGSGDNTVRLWNLDLKNLLSLGCNWLENYLITHPDTLLELEQCQNPSRLLTAANTSVTQGEQLATDGDLAGAVAKFQLAKTWNPKFTFNPEAKAKPLVLVFEGREKANDADFEAAVAKFQQAQQFDPKVDLDPSTQELENNPQAVAKKLVVPALVTQGTEKANNADFGAAVAKFQQAQQFDPKVDLDPDTEGLQNNPEATAKKLVAEVLVNQGKELLKQGDVKKAISKYADAQKLDPKLKISANSWNSLCWDGSLHNHAADVMFACEKAVALAPKDDNIRDSRGLARALTGDTKGAIEDFEAYIKSTTDAEVKAQRQSWVKALRAGKNPFTAQELEKLR